ncbi:HIT domain-containing protein [Chishuiella sp.]|uniref:HIT family protein n=1 Tax=Chishuiella sp. TaxID=1969467 RepID=UPI0028AC3D93|nr:HIT domain-containing protein [Chishuiella sp.]
MNKGHLPIIPKIDVLDFDELEDSLLLKLTLLSKKILIQLKKEYNLDGYTIMQNGGDFNDIGHLHVHLFPRYHNDGFDWVYRKE